MRDCDGGAVLESERLRFSRLTDDDAAFMLALLNDPDFVKYIGDRGVRTPEQARDYMREGPIDSYERNGYGLYRVTPKGSDVPVGICGLVRREGLDAPDLGFAFLPRFRGQGYATEAARAVLDHASGVLQQPRVLAIADTDNAPSNAILVTVGMRVERVMRLPDGDTDLNLYVLDTRAGPV